MGSSREDKIEVISEYIVDEYLDEEDEEEESITPDTPLISSGIVDSFSMVSLKAFLEKKYGIAIPDEKATPDSFDTVNGIISVLDELGV